MKIILFLDSLGSGGKERQAMELMNGLVADRKNELELVLMARDVHFKEVYDLGIKIHFVIRKTKRDISVFGKFYKICKDFSPDVVQCWDSMTAVYLVPVVKLLKIKFVNAMIQDAPALQNFRNKAWLRGRITFPFSDIVVGNSLAGLKAYRAPANKSVCVYNGYDIARVNCLVDSFVLTKEFNLDEDKYVVGMVATFSVFKDYKTYYKAAEILLSKRKDIIFLSIGKNTDSQESKIMVNPDIEGNFRFLGTRTNIESIISLMDVCVLATYTEGISNSVLEYMVMKKPVVVTDGGGSNELVEDGKNGYLVNVSDPQHLADKIEILLNNEELRYRMGTAGHEKVKEVFSNSKMVAKFESIYRDVAEKKI